MQGSRTGCIEILAKDLQILNAAKSLPFQVCEKLDAANEELRLRYRYIDLRRGDMLRNLKTRYEVTKFIRSCFDEQSR